MKFESSFTPEYGYKASLSPMLCGERRRTPKETYEKMECWNASLRLVVPPDRREYWE